MPVLLSIVIPAFNVEAYVTAAVRSAVSQTFADLEVIVVDDGSTDNTYARAASITSDKLSIIRQPNAGLAAARNTGIRAARGDLIGFLDADDCWHPAKAQRHVESMRRFQDVDLSFAWWRVIDDAGRDTGRRGKPGGRRIGFDELILGNLAGNGSTVVARKSAIARAGYFDTSFTALEDHHLWLRIARLRDRNILCIQEVLSDYRMRASQLTRDWPRMLSNWEKLMAEIALLEPERVAAGAILARARYLRYLAYLAYEAGDYATARRFLRRALQAAPALIGDRGAWMTIAAVLGTYFPESFHQWLAASAKHFRAYRAGLQ